MKGAKNMISSPCCALEGLFMFFYSCIYGSRVGTVVRVLASYQCVSVRIMDPESFVDWVCCWFSTLLQELHGYSSFPLSSKTNISFLLCSLWHHLMKKLRLKTSKSMKLVKEDFKIPKDKVSSKITWMCISLSETHKHLGAGTVSMNNNNNNINNKFYWKLEI